MPQMHLSSPLLPRPSLPLFPLPLIRLPLSHPLLPPTPRSLDKLSSCALVAASTIVASCMSRATLSVRTQVDKSVREAVAAKKHACDALDKLAILVTTADSNTGASDTLPDN